MRGGLASPTVESADEAYRFGAFRLDEGLDPLPGAVREDLVDSPRAYLRNRGELEPHCWTDWLTMARSFLLST